MRYLSQARLLDLVATSTHEAAEALRRALDPSNVELQSPTVVRASHVLSIYKVRLRRWVEEGVPPSIGLEAFVEAIAQCGDAEVALVSCGDSRTHLVVLLRADLAEVFGMTAIDRNESGN